MKRIRQKSKATEQDVSKDYHSQSHLPNIKKHALELPKIRRRTYFTDDVSVSEDYIRISETVPHKQSQPTTSRDPASSRLKSSRYIQGVIEEEYPIEDRIHQRHEDNIHRYKRIINYVRWKSKENQRRRNSQGLDFIHSRLSRKKEE